MKSYWQKFDDAHDASYDVAATARSFFGLIEKRLLSHSMQHCEEIVYEEPKLEQVLHQARARKKSVIRQKLIQRPYRPPFVHLHVHSQFCIAGYARCCQANHESEGT